MAGNSKKRASTRAAAIKPPIYSDLLNALQGPDDELGAQLLATFVFLQAQALGMNEVTEDFFAKVVQHIRTLEVGTARLAAVEKTLHLAAVGEFKRSGRLFREYMNEGGRLRALENIAARYVPVGIRRTEQVRDFGRRGGSTKKEQGQKNRNDILDAAFKIFRNRHGKPSDHELARLISERIPLSKHTIRPYLRKERSELEALWVKSHKDKG